MIIGKSYLLKYKWKSLFGKIGEKTIYGEVKDIQLTNRKPKVVIEDDNDWGDETRINMEDIIEYREVEDKWDEGKKLMKEQKEV